MLPLPVHSRGGGRSGTDGAQRLGGGVRGGGQLVGGQRALVVTGVQVHPAPRTAGMRVRMRVGVLLLHLPVGQRTVRPLARRQLIHVIVYFTRNVWRRLTRVVELKKE